MPINARSLLNTMLGTAIANQSEILTVSQAMSASMWGSRLSLGAVATDFQWSGRATHNRYSLHCSYPVLASIFIPALTRSLLAAGHDCADDSRQWSSVCSPLRQSCHDIERAMISGMACRHRPVETMLHTNWHYPGRYRFETLIPTSQDRRTAHPTLSCELLPSGPHMLHATMPRTRNRSRCRPRHVTWELMRVISYRNHHDEIRPASRILHS